ncbi:hypothetical protein M758_2G158400 [Ceratodon purpureus]|nr:hypothetical protein M758_2G158400 [Ceratodon purpureus]
MASIAKSVVWRTSVLLIVLVMVASSVEATRTLDDDPAGVRHDELDVMPQVLTTVKAAACAILGLPCGSEVLQGTERGLPCIAYVTNCCSGRCVYIAPLPMSYCA